MAGGIGLAFSGAVLVCGGADGCASAGGGVPVASAEVIALCLTEACAILDAVTVGVDNTASGRAA